MFQLQVFVMLKSTEHDLKMPEHYRFCFVCKKSIKNKKGLVSTCCEKSISMCKFTEWSNKSYSFIFVRVGALRNF